MVCEKLLQAYTCYVGSGNKIYLLIFSLIVARLSTIVMDIDKFSLELILENLKPYV